MEKGAKQTNVYDPTSCVCQSVYLVSTIREHLPVGKLLFMIATKLREIPTRNSNVNSFSSVQCAARTPDADQFIFA